MLVGGIKRLCSPEDINKIKPQLPRSSLSYCVIPFIAPLTPRSLITSSYPCLIFLSPLSSLVLILNSLSPRLCSCPCTCLLDSSSPRLLVSSSSRLFTFSSPGLLVFSLTRLLVSSPPRLEKVMTGYLCMLQTYSQLVAVPKSSCDNDDVSH